MNYRTVLFALLGVVLLAGTAAASGKKPNAPVFQTPSPGLTVSDSTPTFSWLPATDVEMDPLTYDLQVASDSSFFKVVLARGKDHADAANTTFTPAPAQALADGTYYWRVRAHDGTSYGDWAPGAPISFTVKSSGTGPGPNPKGNTPPGAPTLHSPAKGARVSTSTVDLQWYPESDPDGDPIHYIVEWSPDKAFPTHNTRTEWLQSSDPIVKVTIPGTLASGIYHWRVQAWDGSDRGPWSETWSFLYVPESASNQAPSKPELVSPVGLKQVTDSRPVLVWKKATDPEGDTVFYKVQVFRGVKPSQWRSGTVEDWDPANMKVTGDNVEWQVTKPLEDGQIYYWWVRAEDFEGNVGEWSKVGAFLVKAKGSAAGNQPPKAPVLESPIGIVSVDTARPVLVWRKATDPENDPVGYRVQVAIANTFTWYVIDEWVVDAGSLSRITMPIQQDLATGRRYYWRVMAFDEGSDGPWSTTGIFIVKAGAAGGGGSSGGSGGSSGGGAGSLPVPTPSFPTDGATINVARPTLQASAVTDAGGLHVTHSFEVSSDSGFGKVHASGTASASTDGFVYWAMPDRGQLYDGEWYWRVRAGNGKVYSAWSQAMKFTVQGVGGSGCLCRVADGGASGGGPLVPISLAVFGALVVLRRSRLG